MWRLTRIWDSIKATAFRLRYGFDKRDCWNLDLALAKWLAPRLKYLSETTHTYRYDAFLTADEAYEKWTNELLLASNSFDTYSKRYECDEAWTLSEERQNSERARKAIRWVADHFEQLWD